jgi:hypothetical protein
VPMLGTHNRLLSVRAVVEEERAEH